MRIHPSKLIATAFLLMIAPSVHSQTEIWRSDGQIKQVRPDGHGNAFFLRAAPDTWYGSDTLVKVDPDGTLLWSEPLNAPRSTIYQNGEGVYVISEFPSDSIAYYDAGGALLWKYAHPDPHLSITQHFEPLSLVDPDGNLVYAALNNYLDGSHIVGNHGTLLKLSKDGTTLFEVPLPDMPPQTTSKGWSMSQTYDGPCVDRTGNIWMALHRRSLRDVTSSKGVHTSKAIGATDFLLFDGADGHLRIRKTVFQGYEEDLKESPDGTYRRSATSFPIFERFAVGQGLFVGFGSAQTEKEQYTRRGNKTVLQNFWLVAAVDAAGNTSTFKYKGKGKESTVDGTDTYQTDGSSNYLDDAWVSDDNSIYLAGEISSGMVKNGMGNLHWDYVLMKLSNKKKVVWKKLYPDGQAEYQRSFFFHRGEQKMMLVDQEQKHVTVFSADGAAGTSALAFPDVLWRFTAHNDPMVESNTEAGVIYAAAFGSSDYGAKYSLPPMSFGPAGAVEHTDSFEDISGIPEQREVAANYPNPFNPSTTISIDLPVDAVVTLKVYNAIGQLVAILAENEPFFEGENEIEFDGTRHPSGLYLYRLTATDPEGEQAPIRMTGKMILMK